jgi:hypothetical protein
LGGVVFASVLALELLRFSQVCRRLSESAASFLLQSTSEHEVYFALALFWRYFREIGVNSSVAVAGVVVFQILPAASSIYGSGNSVSDIADSLQSQVNHEAAEVYVQEPVETFDRLW